MAASLPVLPRRCGLFGAEPIGKLRQACKPQFRGDFLDAPTRVFQLFAREPDAPGFPVLKGCLTERGNPVAVQLAGADSRVGGESTPFPFDIERPFIEEPQTLLDAGIRDLRLAQFHSGQGQMRHEFGKKIPGRFLQSSEIRQRDVAGFCQLPAPSREGQPLRFSPKHSGGFRERDSRRQQAGRRSLPVGAWRDDLQVDGLQLRISRKNLKAFSAIKHHPFTHFGPELIFPGGYRHLAFEQMPDDEINRLAALSIRGWRGVPVIAE